MKELVYSIRKSIKDHNLYSAVFVALTIPDICGKIENPNIASQTRYREWFHKYLTQYESFLSGDDCYALRCAVLHEGNDDISEQQAKETIEHFVFLTEGNHLSLFKDCDFGEGKETFLQLNATIFCEDMCIATEKWLNDNSKNLIISKKLENIFYIHKPGYVYKNAIKFG